MTENVYPGLNQGSIAQKTVDSNRLDDYLFFFFIIYHATFVFEGLMRYAFASIGMENLLYLRDGIYVLSIASVSIRSVYQHRHINSGLAFLALIFFFHLCIGYINGTNLFSLAFGLKMFFSLIYGCVLWPIVAKRFDNFLTCLQVFAIAIFISLVLQKLFGVMFWENQTFNTAFGSDSTSREWYTHGERRLAGFARTSFDAAVVVGLGMFAMLLKYPRFRTHLAISLMALVAIYWTTTKGMLLAALVVSGWILVFRGQSRKVIGCCLATFFFCLLLLVPSIVVFYELVDLSQINKAPFLMSSLWDRFARMWPTAIELFSNPIHFISGLGIGSIGTPQNFSDAPHLANAGDSLFVYCYVTFGLLAVVYLAILLFGIWFKSLRDRRLETWWVGVVMMAFVYGMTTNIIEQVLFSCSVGLAFGAFIHSVKTTAQSSEQPMEEKG